MQQRGDRFILRAAILDDDRRDGQQMTDVRNRRAFAGLIGVQLMRQHEGVFEAVRCQRIPKCSCVPGV